MARVLMVDDQEIGLKILGELIGACGHDFQTATNGMEAMEKTRTFQPDIILLDIMMPGMGGYEVCRRLKADPQTQAIPVMQLTVKIENLLKVKELQDFLQQHNARHELLPEAEARNERTL